MDVIAALGEPGERLLYPCPLPAFVLEAARDVQRTLGLADPDWLNATVATSWAHRWPEGLPPGLLTDVEWRTYGTLEVGLVGRASLIPLRGCLARPRTRKTAPLGGLSRSDWGGQALRSDLETPSARYAGTSPRGGVVPTKQLLKMHAVVNRSRVRLGEDLHTVVEVDLGDDAARKHLGDVVALAPTADEWDRAAAWVQDQDTSPQIGAILDAVHTAVLHARR